MQGLVVRSPGWAVSTLLHLANILIMFLGYNHGPETVTLGEHCTSVDSTYLALVECVVIKLVMVGGDSDLL